MKQSLTDSRTAMESGSLLQGLITALGMHGRLRTFRWASLRAGVQPYANILCVVCPDVLGRP